MSSTPLLDVGRNRRAEAIAVGAAQWRDPSSWVRREARERLRDGIWSASVVEAALDAALWDLDASTARRYVAQGGDEVSVLAILPGNVIGPALACAYCAACAGSHLILKAASDERHLAEIVALQFRDLGEPLSRAAEARYWRGGDPRIEADVFAAVSRIVTFGENATIEDVRRRAPAGVHVVGYGESYSIGVVGRDADVQRTARSAAIDVCMFDQRGCMSPQTVYVAGPNERAAVFAHALSRALAEVGRRLPRARLIDGESAAVANLVRRLAVSVLDRGAVGRETLIVGGRDKPIPDFVIAVEPFGPPRRAGFGRIVSVRPFRSIDELSGAVRSLSGKLDTVGIAGDLRPRAIAPLGPSRICMLGEMQRPPFGYRPRVDDFRGLSN